MNYIIIYNVVRRHIQRQHVNSLSLFLLVSHRHLQLYSSYTRLENMCTREDEEEWICFHFSLVFF